MGDLPVILCYQWWTFLTLDTMITFRTKHTQVYNTFVCAFFVTTWVLNQLSAPYPNSEGTDNFLGKAIFCPVPIWVLEWWVELGSAKSIRGLETRSWVHLSLGCSENSTDSLISFYRGGSEWEKCLDKRAEGKRWRSVQGISSASHMLDASIVPLWINKHGWNNSHKKQLQ